jgi:hypothetical protein
VEDFIELETGTIKKRQNHFPQNTYTWKLELKHGNGLKKTPDL